MATDWAVYYLTQPFGLLMQLLLLVAPAVLLRLVAPTAFSKLGFRRIAFGQLAVAAVTFLLAAWSAYSLGTSKVELGHIQPAELTTWVAGNSVYLFVLSYIFALAIASLVLVPFCIWLAHRGRASLVALFLLGVGLAIGLSALTVAFPSNDWGREHPVALFMSTLSSFGVGMLAVALAFGIGARLPFRVASPDNAT